MLFFFSKELKINIRVAVTPLLSGEAGVK